jgi:hypothetical protein
MIGGPDDGNLVTGVEQIRCCFDRHEWLDGPDRPPTARRTRGAYVWDSSTGTWRWQLWSDHSIQPHLG